MSAGLDLPPDVAEAVAAHLRRLQAQGMTGAQIREVAIRLRRELAARRHARAVELVPEHDSPGALAVALGHEQRAHLALIDRELVKAVELGGQRTILNVAPRHGKSQRVAKVGPLWALRRNPDMRVILASHTYDLVEEDSRWIRDQLEDPETDYGLRLRQDSRALSRWNVEGRAGGLLVASVGGRITGFGGDLIVIDDVHANREQADSKRMRDRAYRFVTETAFSRLEPGGSIFIVMTRWHEDDVTGRLLREQPGVWNVISVPAIREQGMADPLDRPYGEPLWPERYDVAALAEIRLVLGARTYAANYQQQPTKQAGGLWKEEWISEQRATEAPPLSKRVVAVDPSASDDTSGDEAGIVAVGRTEAAHFYVTHDLSGHLTPEGWARRALVASIELDADVVYERNLTPAFMRRAFATAWRELQAEAERGENSTVDDTPTPVGHVAPEVGLEPVELPRLMPRLFPVRAKVGKALRAGPVAQVYEQRRAHHVGAFPVLEGQQTTWDPASTDDSPDRLDALVHAVVFLGDAPGKSKAGMPSGTVPTGAATAARQH